MYAPEEAFRKADTADNAAAAKMVEKMQDDFTAASIALDKAMKAVQDAKERLEAANGAVMDCMVQKYLETPEVQPNQGQEGQSQKRAR